MSKQWLSFLQLFEEKNPHVNGSELLEKAKISYTNLKELYHTKQNEESTHSGGAKKTSSYINPASFTHMRNRPRAHTPNRLRDKSSVAVMEKGGRCWKGYEPVPGRKPYSRGSCRKVKMTSPKSRVSSPKPDRSPTSKDNQEHPTNSKPSTRANNSPIPPTPRVNSSVSDDKDTPTNSKPIAHAPITPSLRRANSSNSNNNVKFVTPVEHFFYTPVQATSSKSTPLISKSSGSTPRKQKSSVYKRNSAEFNVETESIHPKNSSSKKAASASATNSNIRSSNSRLRQIEEERQAKLQKEKAELDAELKELEAEIFLAKEAEKLEKAEKEKLEAQKLLAERAEQARQTAKRLRAEAREAEEAAREANELLVQLNLLESSKPESREPNVTPHVSQSSAAGPSVPQPKPPAAAVVSKKGRCPDTLLQARKVRAYGKYKYCPDDSPQWEYCLPDRVAIEERGSKTRSGKEPPTLIEHDPCTLHKDALFLYKGYPETNGLPSRSKKEWV